jgi:DNA-binding transcriptional ArsR family regulator
MVEMSSEVLEMPAADELDLVTVMQALSDPVRLTIVRELHAGGEQACGIIPLDVSASTRSHHLKILREAGVTVTRVVGKQRLVQLRRAELERRFPGLLDAVLRSV